jgi:plastocyanin
MGGSHRALRAFVLASAAAAAFGCGGSDSSTAPSPSPGPSGGTFTITSAGVSPTTLTVKAGSQVTFVNNDNQSHNMLSDPHPEHTDCPELNQVGFLSPGQSRQSGNLNTVRTCGFHDHDLPPPSTAIGNKWTGKIIIQ